MFVNFPRQFYCCRPKLALEYQGKATKIRQKLYGDSDARTVASLDFFTVVYAQVGKQQYAGMRTIQTNDRLMH